MTKIKDLLIIGLIYSVTLAVTLWIISLLNIDSLVLKALTGTIFATVIIFIFSVVFKNSSIYDPYWSVQPLVILPFFVQTWNLASIILLAVVYYWGIRLTINWMVTFKDLTHQDWRYSYFKAQSKKFYPVINFFGIHMMPTIIVFLVMLPGMIYLQAAPEVNAIILLGAAISVFATTLQLLADQQAHAFRKAHPDAVNNQGLWKYSRHPNYLGEILMWFGLFVMSLGVETASMILIIGPMLNLMLFMFISIPLMEKRQVQNKSDYKYYQEQVNPLLMSKEKHYLYNLIATKKERA